MTGNHVYGQPYRGFESLPLRQPPAPRGVSVREFFRLSARGFAAHPCGRIPPSRFGRAIGAAFGEAFWVLASEYTSVRNSNQNATSLTYEA
jgi:hypothetical protein